MHTWRLGTLTKIPGLVRPQHPPRYIAITAFRSAGSIAIAPRRRPLSTSSAQSHPSERRPTPRRMAPLILHPHGYTYEIPNTYSVIFKKKTTKTVIESHFAFLESAKDVHPLPVDSKPNCAIPDIIYDDVAESVVDGYRGTFSAAVLEELRARPEVKRIEQEYYFWFKGPGTPDDVETFRNIVL